MLCEKIYTHHIIEADETPVLVNHDGRDAGAKSYMWFYRIGRMSDKNQIVIYQYQKTRNASHPREFLKGFKGVCVTDGYQVYHTIADEREDLSIAGCWAHYPRTGIRHMLDGDLMKPLRHYPRHSKKAMLHTKPFSGYR